MLNNKLSNNNKVMDISGVNHTAIVESSI